MADKNKQRKRETKYGNRLKRRKTLARKIGSGAFYLISSGDNSGIRMPKAMAVLRQLAREKGISISD